MIDVKVWTLLRDTDNKITPSKLETVDQTETEQQLEELIVKNPDLLMEGLKFVGRQTPTVTGALDLLGVDKDGFLVIFELKKGKVHRDAVTQVIDYASFLAELDRETLCQHIADRSGFLGINKIEDFQGWYQEEFGSDMDALDEPPKMVIVGLGYDDNAKRMVNFLSESELNISLITFYGFKRNSEIFLARQVEVSSIETKAGKKEEYTKVSNQAILDLLIERVNVKDLYTKLTNLIVEALPTAYVWPNRTCRSFSLIEKTEAGKPSNRSYVALYLNEKANNAVNFSIHKRAIDHNYEFFNSYIKSNDSLNLDNYGNLSISIKRSDSWDQWEKELIKILDVVKKGWEEKISKD